MRGFFGSPTAAFAQASSRLPGSQARFAQKAAYLFYLASIDSAELHVWGWDGNNLVEVCVLSLPAPGLACRWSPDGQYLAVGGGDGLNLKVYKWDGANLTEVASAVPNGVVRGVDWEGNGAYLAVTTNSSPYFYVFSFDGSSLTEVDTFTLEGGGNKCHWRDSYIAVAHDGPPTWSWFSFDGTTITRLDTFPCEGVGYGTQIFPDGETFVVAHSEAPYGSVLQYDAYYGVQRIAELNLSGPGYDCRFSNDDSRLVIGVDGDPHLYLYSVSGSNLNLLGTISGFWSCYGCDIYQDNMHIALVKMAPPTVALYGFTGEFFIQLASQEVDGWNPWDVHFLD